MASKRTNGASPIPKGDTTPGADSPHNPREGAKQPARTPVQNSSASQTPVGISNTPRTGSRSMNTAPYMHGKQQMVPVGNASSMDSPAGGRKSAASDAPPAASNGQMDEYDLMLNEETMTAMVEGPTIPQPIMHKLASHGLVAPTAQKPVAVAPGGMVGGTWPPGLGGGFERSGAANPVGQHSESPGNLLGSQPPTPSVRPGSRAPNGSVGGGEERESSPNLIQAVANTGGSVSPSVPTAGRSFVLSPNAFAEKGTPRSKKYVDPLAATSSSSTSVVRKNYLSKPTAMNQQALSSPGVQQDDVAKFSNATSNKSTKNIQRPRPSRASQVSDGSTTNSAANSLHSTKTQAATVSRGIAELEAQSVSSRRSRRVLRSNASAFSDTQSTRSMQSVPSPTKMTTAQSAGLSHPAIQAASGRK